MQWTYLLGDAHLLGPAKSTLVDDGVHASQKHEVADLKARLWANFDDGDNLLEAKGSKSLLWQLHHNMMVMSIQRD